MLDNTANWSTDRRFRAHFSVAILYLVNLMVNECPCPINWPSKQCPVKINRHDPCMHKLAMINKTVNVQSTPIFRLATYSMQTRIRCSGRGRRFWSSATSTAVSTWMGDRKGRPSAVKLCPFVGVDLNLWQTVYIAVIVLARTQNESNSETSVQRACGTIALSRPRSPWPGFSDKSSR